MKKILLYILLFLSLAFLGFLLINLLRAYDWEDFVWTDFRVYSIVYIGILVVLEIVIIAILKYLDSSNLKKVFTIYGLLLLLFQLYKLFDIYTFNSISDEEKSMLYKNDVTEINLTEIQYMPYWLIFISILLNVIGLVVVSRNTNRSQNLKTNHK